MCWCHQNGTFSQLSSNGQKLSRIHIFGTITIFLLLVQDLASTPTIYEVRTAMHGLPLDNKSSCDQDNKSPCNQDTRSLCCQDIRFFSSPTNKKISTRGKHRPNTAKDTKYAHFTPGLGRIYFAVNMTKSKGSFWTNVIDKEEKDSDEVIVTKSQVYIPFDRGIKVKAMFGQEGEGLRTRARRQVFKGASRRPAFIQPEDTILEVLRNAKAFLNCRVTNLGKHTVSWIRQKDLQILSVGSHIFTTDKRLSLTYHQRNQNYRLEIRQVRKEDFGSYECQINTKPMQTIIVDLSEKSIPIPSVHKTVQQTRNSIDVNGLGEAVDLPEMSGAKTDILGGPDIYVHPNSLVNITCVVLASSKPKHIFWSHEGQGLTYHSREGVSIVIDEKGHTTVSQLLIKSISPSDQGTYQCKPENHMAAQARLFIIEDAVSDATRVNSASVFPPWPKIYALLILVVSRKQITNG